MLKPIIINEKPIEKSALTQFMSDIDYESFGLTSLMCKMLYTRGIDTKSKVNKFLHPDLTTMYDPFLLKGMTEATNCIKKHVEAKNQIVIYGDYDVDGVTSTTILYKMLEKCGARVDYYIPDRISEGYGINSEALTKLKNQGASVVISVDTGITAVEQVAHGNEIGLDMIITDHHECQEVIPEALAVINPKQEDCQYPYKMLAGVGVTFKLVQGLATVFNIEDTFVLNLLEIVAVGTISDLVPLVDENRTFVYQAFKRMKTIHNTGLDALVQVSGVDTDKLSAGSIGFQIGPRLNAAGRLGDAKRGVKLFLCEDKEEALHMAEELNKENQKRREMEAEITLMADEIIQKNIDVESSKVLVVAGQHWHHGVIGIVASRITEKYYRPTILLAVQDGIASGSARSVDGFSIFDALMSCKDLLNKFGGHDMAAGMSLDEANIPLLSQRLNDYAKEHMTKDTLIQKATVEQRMSPSEISVDFIQGLAKLEPYGMGNEEPRFLINGFIDSLGLMGKDQNHFKMSVASKNGSTLRNGLQSDAVDVIGFYSGDYIDEVSKDMEINIIGTLNVNEWKGFKKPQVFIKSLKYEDEYEVFTQELKKITLDLMQLVIDRKQISELTTYINSVDSLLHIKLTRHDCVQVYKYIKHMTLNGTSHLNLMKLDLMAKNQSENKRQLAIKNIVIIMIFRQLELIDLGFDGESILKISMKPSKKVELEKSTLYNEMYCKNDIEGD